MNLRLLARIAKTSTHHQHHHVAIVERGGSIVAMAVNVRDHHAEIRALKQLWPDHRIGTRLWSLRFTKGGHLANALPCSNCMEFIKKAGVRLVRYSDVSGNIQKLRP